MSLRGVGEAKGNKRFRGGQCEGKVGMGEDRGEGRRLVWDTAQEVFGKKRQSE